jgi:hypothetical protein
MRNTDPVGIGDQSRLFQRAPIAPRASSRPVEFGQHLDIDLAEHMGWMARAGPVAGVVAFGGELKVAAAEDLDQGRGQGREPLMFIGARGAEIGLEHAGGKARRKRPDELHRGAAERPRPVERLDHGRQVVVQRLLNGVLAQQRQAEPPRQGNGECRFA